MAAASVGHQGPDQLVAVVDVDQRADGDDSHLGAREAVSELDVHLFEPDGAAATQDPAEPDGAVATEAPPEQAAEPGASISAGPAEAENSAEESGDLSRALSRRSFSAARRA